MASLPSRSNAPGPLGSGEHTGAGRCCRTRCCCGAAPQTQNAAQIRSQVFPEATWLKGKSLAVERGPDVSLPAHVLLADHSGKAWGCTETLEDSHPSRCYCNQTSNPCWSAEADRAAYPCAQDLLVCTTPIMDVSFHHTSRMKTQEYVPSFCSVCPLNTTHFFFLSLYGVLRCSFSSPLKNMAWKNAKRIHTWHRADACLNIGESYRRVCFLNITKIRESWASHLLSKQHCIN